MPKYSTSATAVRPGLNSVNSPNTTAAMPRSSTSHQYCFIIWNMVYSPFVFDCKLSLLLGFRLAFLLGFLLRLAHLGVILIEGGIDALDHLRPGRVRGLVQLIQALVLGHPLHMELGCLRIQLLLDLSRRLRRLGLQGVQITLGAIQPRLQGLAGAHPRGLARLVGGRQSAFHIEL